MTAALIAALWFALPINPEGATSSCGNAIHAFSMSTDHNGTAPTRGDVCHAMGVARLREAALVVVVGLLVASYLSARVSRRSDWQDTL